MVRDHMIDKNVFYGANRVQTLVGTPNVSDTFNGAKYSTDSPTALNAAIARVWTVDNSGGDVNLPSANDSESVVGRVGGPTFLVINLGASSINVKDPDSTTVIAVGVGKAAIICLADNSSVNGQWFSHLRVVA